MQTQLFELFQSLWLVGTAWTEGPPTDVRVAAASKAMVVVRRWTFLSRSGRSAFRLHQGFDQGAVHLAAGR